MIVTSPGLVVPPGVFAFAGFAEGYEIAKKTYGVDLSIFQTASEMGDAIKFDL